MSKIPKRIRIPQELDIPTVEEIRANVIEELENNIDIDILQGEILVSLGVNKDIQFVIETEQKEDEETPPKPEGGEEGETAASIAGQPETNPTETGVSTTSLLEKGNETVDDPASGL